MEGVVVHTALDGGSFDIAMYKIVVFLEGKEFL